MGRGMLWVNQFGIVDGEVREESPWVGVFPEGGRVEPQEAADLFVLVEPALPGSEDYCRDLSQSGIFIQTLEPPPVGAEVDVSLRHPTTPQFLPLSGNVVRVVDPNPDNPYQLPGAGVAFITENETQKSSLREFLKEFVLLSSDDLPTA